MGQEAAMAHLAEWNNFYVIIGAAAATLTGLLFVLVTLIAQSRLRGTSDTFGAFNTPNIVHYGSALGIAAMLSAPWQVLWLPGLLLGLAGVGGLLYMRLVVRRTHRQTDYVPVLEDRVWHVYLPILAYSALVVAALVLAGNATPALFLVGAAAVLLLFIGIHNAWDNVTFLALSGVAPEQHGQEERRSAAAGKRPTPG
jgi:hypothetical protein